MALLEAKESTPSLLHALPGGSHTPTRASPHRQLTSGTGGSGGLKPWTHLQNAKNHEVMKHQVTR